MTDQASAADRHHDPMSSDKRVLIIGLVVMVALVAVGVVSASLFAGSACRDIGPEPVAAPVAATQLEPVAVSLEVGDLEEHLNRLGADLADAFGPLTGAADVSGAVEVVPLGGGLAATGPLTVALDAMGAEVVASASFDDPAQLVGSGARVYSLALMNELTGQVDALLPLEAGLEPGTCVDTAVVGDPFAFHLDAGGGELLLIRIEEDGEAPDLELRDPIRGQRWRAPLEVPVAPPGILAERVTAALGDELVVAARRVIPGEAQPAAVGTARSDGERRWELAAQDVLDEVGGDEPVWLEVAVVGDEVAVLAAAPERDRARAVLLLVDVSDGTILGVIEPGGGRAPVLDVHLGLGQVWVTWRDDAGVAVERYDIDEVALVAGGSWPGETSTIADGVVLTSSRILQPTGDGEVVEVARAADGLRFIDVVRVGDATSVLVAVGDEHDVLLTFGGSG